MNNVYKNSRLVGIGFKHQHFQQILQSTTEWPDFFEIHAENYFNAAGLNHAQLRQIAERFQLSIHGTGLGLANHCGVDDEHLLKFKKLIHEYDPIFVSEHLCFTQAIVDGKYVHAGDLLPIIRDKETLDICVNNIDKIQHAIGRQLFVENICQYLEMEGHEFDEHEFLNELCQRTGCRLLVDINNLYINGCNFSPVGGYQYTKDWFNNISARFIGQYHVAGSSNTRVHGLLVDDHSQPVPSEVWSLLQHAISQFAVAPTLVEWDNQLPDWSTLASQANRIKQIFQ